MESRETMGEFFGRRLCEVFSFRDGLKTTLGLDGTILPSPVKGYDIFTTPVTVERLKAEGYDVEITSQWKESEMVCRAIVTPPPFTDAE